MKIGLYGGTFSPPHSAHVRAAKLFIREAALDRLYVMPAGIPPHKIADKWGSTEYRLEMTRRAFSSFAEVSDYEIQKEGRSYTVETLRYLKELCPEDELYMLVGEDMFLSFDSWKAPDEIMKLATVVALRRKGGDISVLEDAAEGYKERYGAKIMIIEDEPMEVSSTQIRNLIAAGEDADHLLPESVSEYIKENNLYKNES